jgi:hypothetical protein
MTRGTRILLATVVGGAVLLLATLGAGAAAVYRAGAVAVDVEDGDDRFRFRLPAALIGAAVTLAPDSLLDEAASDLAPLLPAAAAGWRELEAAPDFVLLEIRSDDEQIRVAKSGFRLEISVDGPDARVRVAVPLRSVGSLLRRLEERV